jgi:glucose-6-phosphate 1-epimerase
LTRRGLPSYGRAVMAPATADDLQRRFGIAGLAGFSAGRGGLTCLRLTPDAGEAEVYLHGGHVTHFQPRGAAPVLFLSAESRFGPTAAIRGGIPVIFPWFGGRADDPKAPAHGFARTAEWEVESIERAGGGVTAVLRLTPDASTQASWPHRFVLRERIDVGPALGVALVVENTGSGPFDFEAALHTYLAIGDVREASVTGLAGTTYIDKTAGMARKVVGAAPLRLTAETDSVFLGTPAACVLDDPGGGRRIVVEKEGSATTVVWNPWADKARAMSDLGDDEWRRMICIETANAADDRVTLPPGQRHAMRARIRVEPR